jgi:hypothetical protein
MWVHRCRIDSDWGKEIHSSAIADAVSYGSQPRQHFYCVLVLVLTCRHDISMTRTVAQSLLRIYKCRNIIRAYDSMLGLTKVVFRH